MYKEVDPNEPEVNMISGTTMPSTLGNWLALSEACFGKDSSAVKFLQEKVDEQGMDEPVIADERQMLAVLMSMVAADIKKEEAQNL